MRLFVGQLSPSVDEQKLKEEFGKFGTVLEVQLLKSSARKPTAAAFVSVASKADAECCIRNLDGREIGDMSYSSLRVRNAFAQEGKPKLFCLVHRIISESDLHAIFSPFGSIVEIAVLRPGESSSGKTAAFVKYDSMKSANAAIAALHMKMVVAGTASPMIVKYSESEQQKERRRMMRARRMALSYYSMGAYPYMMGAHAPAPPPPPPYQTSFGPSGLSLPPSSVSSSSPPVAAGAMRFAMSSGGSPHGVPRPTEGPPGANLFIYHLPPAVNDEQLTVMFSSFGRVLSSRVFIDRFTGLSKGFGFVSYETAVQASEAIRLMNGFQLGNKRLKVEVKKPRSEPTF